MSTIAGGNDTRQLARKEQVGADGLTVQTAADVRRVLAEQITQLTANPDLDPARKARLLAQLAPATLRAIEVATLEGRVAAIETALQRRTDHPRPDGTQPTNARTPDEPQSPKARTLAAHYSQFTAEERLRLILAAEARDDVEEIRRLEDSLPRRTFVGPDPAYYGLLHRYWETVLEILLKWVEVSHLVIRKRFAAGVSNVFAGDAEWELLVSRRSSREVMEGAYANFVARREEATANWQWWTAVWNGIDSAITRFCGEAGFERDQLFAIWRPLPGVIEEARLSLAADVQADSELEENVYCTLRDLWPSQAAPKQQTDHQTPAVVGPQADQAGVVNEPKTAKQFRGGTEGGVISTKQSQPAA
jgi:hypothetical protein